VSLGVLDEQIKNVIGDVFLSCSSINYYGPFTGTYRRTMVDKWMEHITESEIITSPNYGLQETLGDPMTIRDWNIMSLPTDDVSVNNGILVTKGERWPLMIDP
jgi:dynein heavy chain